MKKTAISLFLTLFLLSGASAQMKDTTVGSWTGKWDPTDPNCPCYDIQKQAEREYQEMLEKEKKGTETVTPIVSETNDQTTVTNPEPQPVSKEERKKLRKAKKKSRKKKQKRERKKKKKGEVACPE